MKKLVGIVLVVLIVAAGVWYNSSIIKTRVSPETSNSKNVTDISPMVKESTSLEGQVMESTPAENNDTKKVVVEGLEFKFMPSTLSFKKGETVKLVFNNTGKMPHDWVVDELGVRTKVLNGGDSETIEFIPQQAGTFEYYCSVGKHRQMGMKGSIIVE